MMKKITLILIMFLFVSLQIKAQTASTSDNLVAQPIPHRTVPFNITDPGISKTIEFGADLAWASEGNFRRVFLFSGQDQVDIVRASFQPTYPLVGDTALTQAQLNDLNWRLYLINTFSGPNTQLTLNSDHPNVDSYYVGQPARWQQLIKTTAQHFINGGHNVVQVGAFNEPDYSATGQGTINDMYAITNLMKNNSFFNNIRLAGGNVLNCDQAQSWYDYLRPAGVNDGNTHQLAGSFDSFASFISNVRANGHHSTLDEMHNVCEALVGYEYGMQTGIWWGPAEYARGEIAKATDGQRIAYAEHRSNWTSAAVYRTPQGKVQAFGGASERQATTTTYNYISKDRVVYYDGHGPQREFVLEMPGGNGYQVNQPNAERVINITWGEDIQPAISGRYILVNRNSGKVLEVAGGSTADGANVQQGSYSGATYQQWDVTPVNSRVGGDFSYFAITSVATGKVLDDFNWSLDNGANIAMYGNGFAANQQRYLEYVGDGWFNIRSRHSSHCLDVWNASTADGANVVQWEPNGASNQQWRLLPVGAPIEFVAPNTPTSLVTTAQTASIKLSWTASSSSDVSGYSVFRATTANGTYNTIARKVTAVSFVDNTALAGTQYYYKIKAVDNSLNRSTYSNQVSATVTGANALVAQLKFDGTKLDATVNLNHSAIFGTATYGAAKEGTNSLSLNGTNNFVQLSADIANHQSITVASWVYWNGGASWQRIFDFGNSTSEYMFLSPSSGSGQLHFGIKNGGSEQVLTAPALTSGVWSHVAVTLGTSGASMYINGVLVAQSNSVTIRSLNFKPVLNYIGRSQYPDPLLNGRIDDFRVYNYALSAGEVAQLGSAVIYYQLRNRGTGLYLDGMGRTVDGDNCGQYANTAHINSQWELVGVDNGYKQLKNRGTGMFLDGKGLTTNGAVCGQYANTTSQNSHWSVQLYSGIYYRIQNRTTGLFVDGYGYTANGSNVNQYANTGHVNAQWELVQVGSSSRLAEDNEASVEIEDLKSLELVVYPNPMKNVMNIELPEISSADVISVFDLAGKEKMSVKVTSKTMNLDVQSLSPGTYILRLQSGGTLKSKVLIKK
jgi:hypothetical protein